MIRFDQRSKNGQRIFKKVVRNWHGVKTNAHILLYGHLFGGSEHLKLGAAIMFGFNGSIAGRATATQHAERQAGIGGWSHTIVRIHGGLSRARQWGRAIESLSVDTALWVVTRIVSRGARGTVVSCGGAGWRTGRIGGRTVWIARGCGVGARGRTGIVSGSWGPCASCVAP